VGHKRGSRAILVREVAEFAGLLLFLAVISQFAHVPVIVWIGLPLAELATSSAVRRVLIRKTLRTAAAGTEALIRRRAAMVDCLDRSGCVRVRGEAWSAVTGDGFRDRG
jgi:membrane-bound ClpP family serine protease